jgi:hypothetical protein
MSLALRSGPRRESTDIAIDAIRELVLFPSEEYAFAPLRHYMFYYLSPSNYCGYRPVKQGIWVRVLQLLFEQISQHLLCLAIRALYQIREPNTFCNLDPKTFMN